ncbi:MAG: winged helix-turn-helix domain-containing protein [bacterium]
MTVSPVSESLLDHVYGALANATRRGIVLTLASRPATVGQLSKEHHVSLPSLHRHIRVLEEAHLLQRKKVGRTNFVAIDRKGLKIAQGWLAQYYTDWGSERETLENYITSLTNK